ncbi:MAG: GIY-YIG nuclease family protein [Planctomycetota bacterium]|jgi:DNA repair exonuclease SbcCD ATPase subunit
MNVALVLLVLAWSLCPFVLIWVLIKVRDRAKQLPKVELKLAATKAERDQLAGQLTGARDQLEQRETSVVALGKRLLKDNVKFIGSKVTAHNYATSKKKFETVFAFCEKQGYHIPQPERGDILQDLKQSFEEAVRKQWEKEEQARIKRQIREEQKLEAERQRELQRLENQELAVQTALRKALEMAKDEHDAEVERLKAQLQQAQEKLQRAKSMAEFTKAGFVYVISNVGSFGDDIYKVGMTRRLEPLDRVRELGDASVPFRFDVHMMISSDDAPGLETALHKDLQRLQVNKVNPRKEFYRVQLKEIVRLVEKYHGKVGYVASPEALEYNESLSMSEEDFDYVSGELARFEEDEEGYRAGAAAQGQTVGRTTEDGGGGEATAESGRVPSPTESPEVSASDGDRVDRPGASEPSKDKRKAVACPRCKGGIYMDALVNGEGTCPHCGVRLRVRRNR